MYIPIFYSVSSVHSVACVFHDYLMTTPITKPPAEWRDELTPEQYQICRQCGTETPFTGASWDCHDAGIYRCVCCGNAFFDSATKFDSSSGWPSFWQPYKPENVMSRTDTSHGMTRVEACCKQCGGTSGIYSPTARNPPDCAFASTPPRLRWTKTNLLSYRHETALQFFPRPPVLCRL